MPINFTKTQTLILELFFNNPGKAFYLREIARALGKEPGAIQRDMNQLVTKEFLNSYYQANSRFFTLNQKHSIYPEIKSIFFKTIGIKGTLVAALKKIPGINQAFIYGSFARGEEKDSSDVDLCVVGSINENDLIDTLTPLEDKFNREINYVLMTDKEFSKKQKDQNSFLINILKQKTIKLV